MSLTSGSCAVFADVESQILRYDENGKLIDDYSDVTQVRVLRSGSASVQLLAAWQAREDGSYTDPTLGSCATSILMSASPTALADTAALGKPERIDLVTVLGLEKELRRADLVAAAVRSSDGITFYDFDLALPALKCAADLATACLPTKVVLISVGIRNGDLHTVRVDATADQWRRSGARNGCWGAGNRVRIAGPR